MSTECDKMLVELNSVLGTYFQSIQIDKNSLLAAIEEPEYKQPDKMAEILDSYLQHFSDRVRHVLTDDPAMLQLFLGLHLSPTIRVEHAPTRDLYNLYTRAFIDTTPHPYQLVLQIDAERFWSNIGDTAENFASMLQALPDVLPASPVSLSPSIPSFTPSTSSAAEPIRMLSGPLQLAITGALNEINSIYPGLFDLIMINPEEFRSTVTDYKDEVDKILAEYVQHFGANFSAFMRDHSHEMAGVFKARGLSSTAVRVVSSWGPENHPRVLPKAFKMVAGIAIVEGQLMLYINPKRFWRNVRDTAAVRDTDYYFFPENHIPSTSCYCHSGRERPRYVGGTTKGVEGMIQEKPTLTASPSSPRPSGASSRKCFKCNETGKQACSVHASKSSGCGNCAAGRTATCSYCRGTGSLS